MGEPDGRKFRHQRLLFGHSDRYNMCVSVVPLFRLHHVYVTTRFASMCFCVFVSLARTSRQGPLSPRDGLPRALSLLGTAAAFGFPYPVKRVQLHHPTNREYQYCQSTKHLQCILRSSAEFSFGFPYLAKRVQLHHPTTPHSTSGGIATVKT